MTAPLRDPDLRAALVEHLGAARARVRHEVEVRWSVPVRVDVLAVTEPEPGVETLHAFELKSDVDSVARLPRQVQGYEQVAQRCTVVSGRRHAAKVDALVPPWWGLLIVDADGVHEGRPAAANPNLQPLAALCLVIDARVLRHYTKMVDPALRAPSRMAVDDLRQHLLERAGPAAAMELVRGQAVPS